MLRWITSLISLGVKTLEIEEKEVTEIIELSELGYLLIDCDTNTETFINWDEIEST